MSSDNAKKPYNAKRRIQFLSAFSVFLIVAATAGWYFVAGKIDEAAGKLISVQAAKGNVVECDNRIVRGYPFRFGVFCDAVSYNDDKNNALIIKAGAFRSAAQFYDPRKIIGELDGPLVIEQPSMAQDIKVSWSSMRSSFVATNPLPQHVSIVGKDVRIEQSDDAPRIAAIGLESHMRINGNDLDLAGRAQELSIKNTIAQIENLPPLGLDFDATVKDGAALLASNSLQLRGTDLDVRRIGVLLSDDQGLLLSGPLKVDNQGLIDGELTLRIIDVDAVSNLIGKALPNIAPMLSAFAAGQPRSGEKNDEVEMTLSITKSQIRLGFIPLGKLKPL
ncbi:DUF2125 domain-containing protein [Ahrensia sp. 13_GOM-1096m]|uniref:DUF2125 domain-containing protein n=1 Tax=Ahrensia sp. 13_GOM-1096m TaxID=1380380 RepID=UPI00047ADB1E|nr:DUF2125 domain-containing protein [Ahrensia sp. 13_GOM-1096m]